MPYTYLLPILVVTLSKIKFQRIVLLTTLYCSCLFLILFSYDYVPEKFRSFHQIAVTFLEFLFFSLLFRQFISSNKFKKIILIVIPVFFVTQLLHMYLNPKSRFDAIPSGIEAVILLMYTLVYIYQQMDPANKKNIFSQFEFWICLGIMVYLAGTFFFYILANNMPIAQVKSYWFITYLIEIVKNVLFTTSMLILVLNTKRRRKVDDVSNNYGLTD